MNRPTSLPPKSLAVHAGTYVCPHKASCRMEPIILFPMDKLACHYHNRLTWPETQQSCPGFNEPQSKKHSPHPKVLLLGAGLQYKLYCGWTRVCRTGLANMMATLTLQSGVDQHESYAPLCQQSPFFTTAFSNGNDLEWSVALSQWHQLLQFYPSRDNWCFTESSSSCRQRLCKYLRFHLTKK